MNRDELDQASAEVEASEKLLAAKEAFKTDPSEENQAAYAAATAEIQAVRQARRAAAGPPSEGTATPDSVAPAAQP